MVGFCLLKTSWSVPSVHLSMSFSGKLACLDGFMNIALEQTEEYVNGQVRPRNARVARVAQLENERTKAG